MTITAYGENAETALNQAEERVAELEKTWSVTDENSEIYAINHSRRGNVYVSPETAELLDFSLDISEVTIGTNLTERIGNSDSEVHLMRVSLPHWRFQTVQSLLPAVMNVISRVTGRLCDALSTSLFVIGLDKVIELWKQRDDFEMVLVSEEGEIYLTEGLEKNFSLNQMYGNLQTEVIHR